MRQLAPPCTRPYNVRTLSRGYMDGGLRLARSVGMAMRSAGPRGKALTIPQVCRELSVDRRTVYQLIESGALAAYRVGKPYRIDPEDLAAFTAVCGKVDLPGVDGSRT